MKKLTLEATDENILNSIKNDTCHRNSDVKDFVEALETIEGNMFISVDARWGEGKTFFVRQIEKTLEYLTKRTWEDEQKKVKIVEELNPYFQNTVLNSISLNQSYLSIYYNAWLYDNHDDPLMSLIYIIVKKSEQYVATDLDKSKKEQLLKALSSLSLSLNLGFVQVSASGEEIKDALTIEDILNNIKTAEEIRELVKNILDSVINEKSQRLVIFIDELDRCRPSYAIEMLERIKHYFDDDRIIFVMSVNKSQLIHTISKYYGNDFDSNLYLNKFFDINIRLPKADTRIYFDRLGISCDEPEWIKKIANDLQKYYSLSLRDTTRYFQKIVAIYENGNNHIGSDSWKMMMLFIPVVCVLDIVDTAKEQSLLSGKKFDILKELIENCENMRKYVLRLMRKADDNDENYLAAMQELKKIYEFGFSGNRSLGWYRGGLDIGTDLENLCLHICNNVI